MTINREKHQAEVEPRLLLVHLLRDELGLTGTHVGCVVGRCGACTVLWRGKPVKSCMLMAARGLLAQNPTPTEAEIKRAISGNLCRCTGYLNIVTAIREAALVMSE